MTGDEVRTHRCHLLKRVTGERGSNTWETLRLLPRVAQQLKLLPEST